MNDPSFGMGQPPMGGQPGGAPFAPAGFGAPGGFPTPGFAGPPSGYGMPSAMGAPSPFPPMGGYAANGGMHASGFDARAESAFTGAGPSGVGATTGGGTNSYNGGAGAGTYDQPQDPFHFLGSELGNMSLNDTRRQAGTGATKSPN